MRNDQTEQHVALSHPRRGYTKPTLICHGLIGDLTQSGTGSTVEGAVGVDCEVQPASRSCNPV